MEPLVNIGMPVFNCEKTIKTAINSILNQTYSNWELLLIDDGSTDKTLSIAKSFQDSRIKIIADGLNQNLSNRLNQAISMSKGKYFARMDGDDVSYPERLRTQVEYLEQNPQIDLVGTNIIVIDKDSEPQGSFIAQQSHAEICGRPWSGFSLPHPTWMGRLDWFLTHRYNPQALKAQDRELLLRTYQTSRFACIPDILLGYRVESLSLNKIFPARCSTSVSLLKKAIAEKKYFFAFGVVEEAAKALIDIFAISTRLEFKLLRHRLGNPVDATEKIRWQRVWSACNM